MKPGHYLIVLSLLLPAAHAGEVVGRASIVDGDTVTVQGQRVRLYGIDAPGRNQLCSDAKGRQWRCGHNAALAFFDHIGVRPIACEQKSVGRNKELIAICYQGGKDINSWLVSNGWAKADRQASDLYVFEENEAKRARLNLWAGSIVSTPERQADQASSPDRAPSKKESDSPRPRTVKAKQKTPALIEMVKVKKKTPAPIEAVKVEKKTPAPTDTAEATEPVAPVIKPLIKSRLTFGALENFISMPKVDVVDQQKQASESSEKPAKPRCCVYCKEGRPCGDDCVSAGQVCQKPPGCAC